MAIENYNQYVFNPYSTPNVPSIQGINLSTATVSDIESAGSAYLSAASAYVDQYKDLVVMRDYLHDKFMYDLAGNKDSNVIQVDGSDVSVHANKDYMTLDGKGIDYASNAITLHMKVDNTFNTVVEPDGVRSANAAQVAESAFNSLYVENWLTDDHSSCAYSTDANMYGSAVVYDAKAKIANIDDADLNGEIFYTDVANATGNARTWTTNDGYYRVAYNGSASEWQIVDLTDSSIKAGRQDLDELVSDAGIVEDVEEPEVTEP